MSYITPIAQCKKGNNDLYLGDLHAANDHELRQKYNIKAIISVSKYQISIMGLNEYLQIPCKDEPNIMLFRWFRITSEFIERNLEKGSVLIHCNHCISRSPTIAIAYMINKLHIRPDDALSIIHINRPCACPNPGFWKQLCDCYNLLGTP